MKRNIGDERSLVEQQKTQLESMKAELQRKENELESQYGKQNADKKRLKAKLRDIENQKTNVKFFREGLLKYVNEISAKTPSATV